MMVPASNSAPGDVRSGLAPNESSFNITVAPFVVCGVNAIICPLRCASVSNTSKDETVYLVDVPPVTMAPAISSRDFAVAAIMSRAESLTLDGACPSAQLIVESAVASDEASCDHL